MYGVGSKVVYPMHGVGKIDCIEKKDILGNEKLYYILRLSVTDMTVMIPVDMSEKLGLRKVIDDGDIEKVIGRLQEECGDMDEGWKERYTANHDKLKSGSIYDLCDVVRNLYRRSLDKDLSASEKKLFENALQLMVDEISLAKEVEKVEIEHMISESLESGIAQKC